MRSSSVVVAVVVVVVVVVVGCCVVAFVLNAQRTPCCAECSMHALCLVESSNSI
jgi:hypothetical protein